MVEGVQQGPVLVGTFFNGLGLWGEAEAAPVWAPLGDIRVHQAEEVSRIGVELLARDGLSPLLVVFVAAEGGALVL